MFQLSTRSGVFAFTDWIEHKTKRAKNRGNTRLKIIDTLLGNPHFSGKRAYYLPYLLMGTTPRGLVFPAPHAFRRAQPNTSKQRCKYSDKNCNESQCNCNLIRVFVVERTRERIASGIHSQKRHRFFR